MINKKVKLLYVLYVKLNFNDKKVREGYDCSIKGKIRKEEKERGR